MGISANLSKRTKGVAKPATRVISVPPSDEKGFEKKVKEFNKVLTGEQQEALAEYKLEKFEPINEMLRNPEDIEDIFMPFDETPDTLREMIDALDESFFTLEEDATVYRGGWLGEGLKVGDTFGDEAYASTSLSFDVAHGYAEGALTSDFGDVTTVWELEIPKGTEIALPCCEHMDELEILLQRGVKVEVTDITMKGTEVRVIHAVVAPS
ncbi:unnamed protein product [marine sediment metagenome]|uniref:ADP ribosyltransferase domain-containing protein n=1 Tax=marine sediment metagenome TaxID=412755 RepID=X0UWN3_9ZZZZ